MPGTEGALHLSPNSNQILHYSTILIREGVFLLLCNTENMHHRAYSRPVANRNTLHSRTLCLSTRTPLFVSLSHYPSLVPVEIDSEVLHLKIKTTNDYKLFKI